MKQNSKQIRVFKSINFFLVLAFYSIFSFLIKRLTILFILTLLVSINSIRVMIQSLIFSRGLLKQKMDSKTQFSDLISTIRNQDILRTFLKTEKPIVILVSESLRSQQVFAITQWLAGKQIDLGKKGALKYNTNAEPGLSQTVISVQKQFMKLIETSQILLIGLDVSDWIRIDNLKERKIEEVEKNFFQCFLQKFLLFNQVLQIIKQEQRSTKFYSVFQYNQRDENRSKLKEKKTKCIQAFLKTPDIGLIEYHCEDCPNQSGFDHIMINYPPSNFIPKFNSIKELAQSISPIERENISLLYCDQEKKKIKNIILSKFCKLGESIEEILGKIITKTYQNIQISVGHEEQKTSLDIISRRYHHVCSGVLNLLAEMKIGELCDFSNQNPINHHLDSHIYCPERQKQQIPQFFIPFYYFSELKKLYKNFKSSIKEKKNSNDDIFKEFLRSFLLFMNDFVPAQQKIIQNCFLFFENIQDQLASITKITTVPFGLRSIEQIVGKALKNDRDNLAQALFDYPINSDNDSIVFDCLLEIMRNNFEQQRFSIPPKDIREKRMSWDHKLEKFLADKMVKQNLGLNGKKIAMAIQKLYNFYKNRKNMKEQDRQELKVEQILPKCAKLLRTLNRSDLALKIYKKLKHFLKVESCIEQLALEMEEKDKARHYLDSSKYFMEIGDRYLGWKYLQKASEADKNILKEVLEAKNEYFSDENDPSKNQKNLIEQFLKDAITEEEYFDNELDEEFEYQLSKLTEEVSDDEHHIKGFIVNGILTGDRRVLIDPAHL